MVKMTFTLDDDTTEALKRTASRLGKPQSVIVREAIREYDARAGRLSEDERRQQLRAIDAFLARPAQQSAAAADREIAGIRRARRHGGRRSA
jgi:predicted transcriptional regulator